MNATTASAKTTNPIVEWKRQLGVMSWSVVSLATPRAARRAWKNTSELRTLTSGSLTQWNRNAGGVSRVTHKALLTMVSVALDGRLPTSAARAAMSPGRRVGTMSSTGEMATRSVGTAGGSPSGPLFGAEGKRAVPFVARNDATCPPALAPNASTRPSSPQSAARARTTLAARAASCSARGYATRPSPRACGTP